ncbi:hypothetical protein [Escherichia coli]|uniref:hypothetical protein n=1 Tax=Escherichia coli TaxID=562 RepID=UPI003984D636
MRSHKNRKMITFPAGVTIKPLYDECPKCGFDLKQMPEPLVNQIKADDAKNSTGKAKASFKSGSKETLTPNLLNLCIAWMVLPFATAKKYAAKRNQKRFVGWKLRK